jgi:DNA-binding response OmpR family regulator
MKLLLVEDDERVRRFVVRGLQAEGHAIALACDGAEGFDRASSEDYDVLILDVMLPWLDGRQLCARLREANLSTPILMLTALDHTEAKVQALRGGADDYLTKPFDFDELLARIEALGRRAHGYSTEPPKIIDIHNLRIDHEAMTVTVDGTPVALTAKEFQLLSMFVDARGKVLSRTRILNKIWGYDSDPLTNVVDVYVRRLRTTMGWETHNGLIHTVRSYGYRLDPTPIALRH